MIVANIICVAMCLVVAPTGAGMLLHSGKKEDIGFLENWTTGFFMHLVLAQLLLVPATFLHIKLVPVVVVYGVISMIMLLCGLFTGRRNIFIGGNHLGKWLKDTPLVVYLAILLIAVQVVIYVRGVHFDADDAYYVAAATTAVENNSIFEINPFHGRAYASLPARYVLSPFSYWIAILSKMTWVHPTILAHTVLPAILLCVSYGVYALIGRNLFYNDREKTGWMLSIIAVYLAFSAYTTSTHASMMLLRIWQGKAFLAAAILPYMFYLFLRFAKEQESKLDYIRVFVISMAACHVSSMGIILGALFIGCMALVTGILRKNWRMMLRLFCCVIPNVIYTMIFLFVLQ